MGIQYMDYITNTLYLKEKIKSFNDSGSYTVIKKLPLANPLLLDLEKKMNDKLSIHHLDYDTMISVNGCIETDRVFTANTLFSVEPVNRSDLDSWVKIVKSFRDSKIRNSHRFMILDIIDDLMVIVKINECFFSSHNLFTCLYLKNFSINSLNLLDKSISVKFFEVNDFDTFLELTAIKDKSGIIPIIDFTLTKFLIENKKYDLLDKFIFSILFTNEDYKTESLVNYLSNRNSRSGYYSYSFKTHFSGKKINKLFIEKNTADVYINIQEKENKVILLDSILNYIMKGE